MPSTTSAFISFSRKNPVARANSRKQKKTQHADRQDRPECPQDDRHGDRRNHGQPRVVALPEVVLQLGRQPPGAVEAQDDQRQMVSPSPSRTRISTTPGSSKAWRIPNSLSRAAAFMVHSPIRSMIGPRDDLGGLHNAWFSCRARRATCHARRPVDLTDIGSRKNLASELLFRS